MSPQLNSSFRDVSASSPCPVCNHDSWCRVSMDGALVCCRREKSHPTLGPGSSKTDKSGGMYWLYFTGPRPAAAQPPTRDHTEGAANPSTADERHVVYTALLRAFGQTTPVKEELDRRMVPAESPLRKRCRSLPLEGRARVARKLVEAGLEPLMSRTPGFIVKEGEKGKYWTLAGSPGLLIPVTDSQGRIVAIQIRRKEPRAGGKYVWFSSKHKGGAGESPPPIAVPHGFQGDRTVVRVTEGAFKALIATELGGVLTLGLPGLHGRGLVKILRLLGAATIRLAFDADVSRNPHVALALASLHEKLVRAKFAVELELWDEGNGKGIDDLLASGKQPDTLTGTAVSKWIAERLEPAPDSPQPITVSEGPGTTEKKGKKPTIAEILTAIGMSQDLWHDSTQLGFATIGRLSHPIRSKGFRNFLLSEFRRQCPDQMPNAEALNVALMMLEAAAVFDGPEYPVYARIAGHGGKVYLFLADLKNTVIEIDANGWRCCEKPPVRFRRPAGSFPLPMPVPGASIQDLRAHLNVPDDGVFALIVGWLMGCFYPDGPFPVMVLVGEQGSAKTTTARVLKRLIDPSAAVVRCEPREARDLMIQARNNWVLATDNLSHLPPWLSDAMCRLATGGGFSTRELYSNDDEVIFDSKRPQVVNGIEDFVTRPDLLERSIIVRHPTIPEEKRRPESQIWAAFDKAHPRILGAVLDRVSIGLRHLPELCLERLPRMADFALFAVACEGEEVDPNGRSPFLAAYTENQAGAHEQALESSPLPAAIVALMTDKSMWEGPGSDLLRELEKYVQQPLPKDWPKKPNVLTNKLRRLAPDIRRVHRINVNCDGRASDRSRKRIVQITRLVETEGNPPSAPSTPSESGELAEKHLVDSGRSPDGVPRSADDPGSIGTDGRRVRPSDGIPGKAGTSDSADGVDGGSRPRNRRRFRNDDRETDRQGD